MSTSAFSILARSRRRWAYLGVETSESSWRCVSDDPDMWNGGKLTQIVLKQWTKAADFTSGEADQPFRFMPKSRWFEGNQHFLLTYLGHYWLNKWCRYPDEIWIRFLEQYLANGGCICFDMGVDFKTGLFCAEQRRQFRRITKVARRNAPHSSAWR